MSRKDAPSLAPHPIWVEGGQLRGVVDANGTHIAFRGIPFAAPPVGDLRWRPPQAVIPWEGVRVADTFAPMCAQPARPEGSIFLEYAGEQTTAEDCLYLNVFAPLGADNADGAKLPVMVWIHGGAFQVGSSTNATFVKGDLVKRGVVLVTINYRVNALGFLAHPALTAESDHAASGNYGLMDQIAALKWVRRNIAMFGGDAESVTVFGQSAGGASIANLMASPLADGLFDRAIVQSVAYMPMKSLADSEAQGIEFMAHAGVTSLAELRALPVADIVNASRAMQPILWPSIDGWVMPASVDTVFAAGLQMKVPMLAGWTRDEGSVFPAYPNAVEFKRALRARFGDMTAAALTHYPADTDAQAVESSLRINGDALAGAGVWQAACAHASHSGCPVYLYHFEHPQPFAPEQAYLEGSPAKKLGVFHSAEYPYVFGTLQVLTRPWADEDHRLVDTMQRYWTNFAKTGTPNGPDLATWSRLSLPTPATMRLSSNAHMGEIPRLDALEFLDHAGLIGDFL